MIKIPTDHVLVSIETTHEDFIGTDKLKLRLYHDKEVKSEQHIRTYGTVVGIPEKLADKSRADIEPIRREDVQDLSPLAYKHYEFKDYHLDDIEPDVAVGDTIHFLWSAINKSNRVELEDKIYYKIRYDS